MNCPKCKYRNLSTAKFCCNCGEKLNREIECPICHSKNLPLDSKFCPDCGASIINIEEIRLKAKEIVSNFKQGYEFYAKNGTLPNIVENSPVETCNKIISAEVEIAKKHSQIIGEEKKKKEEQNRKDELRKQENYRKLLREVQSICKSYNKGYEYYLNTNGNIESFDEASCKAIIANKDYIVRKHNEIVVKERKRLADERKNAGYESNDPKVIQIQQKARKIAENNYKGYCFYANSLGYSTKSRDYLKSGRVLSLADSRIIIENRTIIIQKQHERIVKKKEQTLDTKPYCSSSSGCMIAFVFLLSSTLSLFTLVKFFIVS